MTFVLAIDQGTTRRAPSCFDADTSIGGSGPAGVPAAFSRAPAGSSTIRRISGRRTLATCRAAMAKAGVAASDIAAIGITNQRETTSSGSATPARPIHRAIVWQDRRTAELCAALQGRRTEPRVTATTGLLLDPYFSGTKLAWILDNVAGARERAEPRRTAPSARSTAS